MIAIRRPRPLPCAAVCALALACGDGRSSSAEPVFTDSAGVTLVTVAETPDAAVRRVVPEVSIGDDPDRPDVRFGSVADVTADPAGRIYVLDRHASRVFVFDPDGRPLHTIGSAGEGPGEIGRFAWSVVVVGDTVAVADWGRALLHRFHRDGAFIDAVRVPFEAGVRSWWRVRGAGGYLVRALARTTDAAGRWRGRDALLRVSPDASAVDTLIRFEYAESDLGGPGDPRVPVIVNAPAWAELTDGRIAWTDLETARVRVHDAAGALRQVVRHAGWTGRVPGEEDRRLLIDRLREKIVGLGGSAATLDDMPLVWPETLPAVTGLVAGPGGQVWVQRMGEAAEVHPSALNTPDPPLGYGGGRWEVLDPGGHPLGVVDLPSGFRLHRVEDDAVLGVQRNALDEDVVRRLRLEPARP